MAYGAVIAQNCTLELRAVSFSNCIVLSSDVKRSTVNVMYRCVRSRYGEALQRDVSVLFRKIIHYLANVKLF